MAIRMYCGRFDQSSMIIEKSFLNLKRSNLSTESGFSRRKEKFSE